MRHGDVYSGYKSRPAKEPYFDNFIDPETGLGRRNVTTVEGGRAVLLCTIRHLGQNNTVSTYTVRVVPVVSIED